MKKLWNKILPYIGPVLTATAGCLELFAHHTVAYKIGIGLGFVLSAFGVRRGYQTNSLPSGLSKQLDRIPNNITGIRGSKK